MSKISDNISNAFIANNPVRIDNTEVFIEDNQVKLSLFGNIIAIKDIDTGKICVSDGNYSVSVTTKSRLNALPNVSVYTQKGIHYLNGKLWNGNFTEV